ncbi:CPBP family intramembrane metalloprotease [Marinobacter hydrocarbonoclasticus]|uniref:CPBP family intramembrane glutamic endopeptidase n=1 Tax=Marinobacter nauticus TaxID=2743 RepID=UPI001C957346|nr:CPBP family intramembrane glutamic endopeptidase [Marinobacter nauticus]MBY6194484.1 CPBP family intramembrane metalloprotease [Marinobacter nauticus]MBY6215632.1 CPBP family intramembrane metalloprotease [Marinobacter nauticus]
MAQSRANISTTAALLFQGGIGLVGWIAIWLFDIPLMLNGLNLLEILLYGILGAGTTYLVLLLLTQLSWLFPDDLGSQMQALYRFAASYRWPVLLTLSLLAGVGEELLFRGAVQGWLMQHTGPWTALLAASVLFGLVHYVSFTYFLVATCLGLILGGAYLVWSSLPMVMVWHAVYDMLALYCLLNYPQWFGVKP